MFPRADSRSLLAIPYSFLLIATLAATPGPVEALPGPTLQQAWSSPSSHPLPLADLWGDGLPRALVEEAGGTKLMSLNDGNRYAALPARYGPLSTMTAISYLGPDLSGQVRLVLAGGVPGGLVYVGVFERVLGPGGGLSLVWEVQPPPIVGLSTSRVLGSDDDLVLLRRPASDPDGFLITLHDGTTGAVEWEQGAAGVPGGVTLQEFDVTGEGVPDWLLEVRSSSAGPISTRLLTSAMGPFVGLPGGPSSALSFGTSGGTPNPFAGETRIAYTLAARRDAVVKVFDPAGRLVRTLARGMHEPGTHAVTWDGRNEAGRSMPSGVYLYEVQSGAERAARQVVRLR
ncbi:MAG: FlgD immunoglobulin-like domain containing protein [Candidatus Eisenbacteria bacterium]